MKTAKIAVVLMLLAGLAIAQDAAREAAFQPAQDLFTTIQSDRSLAMFTSAVQMGGMVKTLREESPLTVFALSNRAFANLRKEDRETLLENHAALNLLLTRYITRGIIPPDDTADLLSARTFAGVKVRADLREEGPYVNGSRFDSNQTRCTNGVIYILNSFDPGLVHEAVALAKASHTEK